MADQQGGWTIVGEAATTPTFSGAKPATSEKFGFDTQPPPKAGGGWKIIGEAKALGGGGRGGLPPKSPEGKEATERAEQAAPQETPRFERYVLDPLKGAAKEALHTAKNISDIGTTASGGTLVRKAVSSISPGFKEAEGQRQQAENKFDQWLETKTGGEKVGSGLMQLVELAAIPETKIAEVAKLPEVATKMARLVHAGKEALEPSLKVAALEYARTKDPASAAIAFGTMEGAGATFGSIRGPLGTWLAKNARETYAKLLKPTGGAGKTGAAETLLSGGSRDLVGRGFISTSTEKLEESAAKKATELGYQLDKAYEKVGEKGKLALKPIFDDVHAFIAKKSLNNDGKTAAPEAEQYVKLGMKRLNDVVEYLGKEFETADPRNLRKFRQMLDDTLYERDPYGRTYKSVFGAKDEVTEALGNAVRRVLNSDPTIGKINQEFHFWQAAREALHKKNVMSIGKSETPRGLLMVGRSIAGSIVGSAGGYYEGRDRASALEGAAIGAGVATMLGEVFASTAWKGVSAVAKDRIARLLIKGAQYEAAGIAAQEAAFKATDPAEKQKLIALSKKITQQKKAQSAVSQSMGASESSALKTVTPPKPGTSSPPQYKPEQWQIKSATEKMIGETGVKTKTPEYKPVAKESYKQVQTEAEKQTEATNAKIEQKKSNTYSAPFGIKKMGEVSTEEGSAISNYKGSGYVPINKSLYMGNVPHQHVQAIDSAIAKHALEADTTLWRGVTGQYAEQLKTKAVGDVISNKGYSSSSSASKVSRSFAGKGGVLIKIDAKAGQAGYPYGFQDAEKEYLLPRNLKFKISKIEKDEAGIPNITVEIIK